MLKAFLAIFIGGGTGSCLRYAISLLLASKPAGFPVATLAANLAGCLLIGAFYTLSEKFGWSQETRLLLTTGLCGGFTTFSTFSQESLTLFRNGMAATAITYIVLSIILGILLALAGSWLASRF